MADDILDLIMYILNKQDKIETRGDTVLHKLIKPSSETMMVTDSVELSTATHPVKWDEFQWDLATWG